MTPTRWFMLGLSLCVIAVAAMFTIQNSGRTTDLSLDLYSWAWHLKRDAVIPYLLWGTLGSGFLVGSVVGRLSARTGTSAANYTAPSSGGYSSTSSADDDWT